MQAKASPPPSKKAQVYNWLLGELLSERLKPGDVLNRRQVATAVGVSVAPVLEAMLQLESEGFLETMPRRGTRVRHVDAAEIRGRMLLREAIEAEAARLYCGPPVAEHMDKLTKLAELVDASDTHAMENWQSEIRFHRELVQLADCPVLTATFDQVMRHSLFYMSNQLLPPPNRKRDPHSHRKLLGQLRRDDPEASDQAIRRHLEPRIRPLLEQAAP